MIFRARHLVFLLFATPFVIAEESSKTLDSAVKVGDPQPIPITTPTPSNSTTASPEPHPKPTTTTPKPTTSTSTTPKPTTTTTTTTQAPTTTTTTQAPPTTSTSTAKPTPTTPPTTPQPTTPKPTPAKNDSWIVAGPNGTICITANMVIKITVPYKSLENKTVESKFDVDHVDNATASGTCNANDAESLVLTWNNVTATFNFALNITDHTYSLDSIDVVIAVNNATFPNNTMTNMTHLHLNYTGKLFSVPQNNSYTCTNVKPMNLNSAGVNSTVSGKLTVAHVHVQAFGTKQSSKYRAPIDCASTETPDIVPIAVGLILAGLVVVVLVAYLVGRRRAQARGYLSM